mgnify:CR=1 FL=1|jgi:hypothetical protein|nr:MAG TPA: Protein of unknown function (DUF551) [Caudoviricetes sp.]
MKQTVEDAAKEHQAHFEICDTEGTISGFTNGMHKQSYESFISGVEWQSKQSPWISVKERLPEKPKYDWVLVTIRDKRDGFIGLPQIGELRSDGFWHTRESDDFNTEQFRREYGTTDALGVLLHQEVLAWLPIPSFDDILEANRDVLERIKEKGD